MNILLEYINFSVYHDFYTFRVVITESNRINKKNTDHETQKFH